MNKHKPGLVDQAKAQLVHRFLARRSAAQEAALDQSRRGAGGSKVDAALCQFSAYPAYKNIQIQQAGARQFGIDNPFFKTHDALAGASSQINGRTYLNFSSYNYLNLSGDARVNRAAIDAIERYGTSPSASRLVAGERPVQRELEEALADVYGVEDCVVMVSGHATNVTTIGTLFGPKDLVVHDALIHNSVLEGIRLSGATRRSFAHNDHQKLDQLLSEIRVNFERVLIVIEGLYSMDGDTPELARFIEIKKRHKAFLMVDEAHALGVLGARGLGSHEHSGLCGKDVDIWMGTLSKSLASCGGYIAGDKALVSMLKYAAPGFVYSVGLAPVLAAAALAALQIMREESGRVAALRAISQYCLAGMQEAGVDTGLAQGFPVIPALVGNSIKAIQLSNRLFQAGINAQPIIHPAVEEKAARLRFFLSSAHEEKDIDRLVNSLHVCQIE